MNVSERRRAGRIDARLYSRIRGVDADWQLRRANLSLTGLFLEIDRELGEPGVVQEVALKTFDHGQCVDILSRVVRIFSTDDIWRGKAVAGIAFDFMLPTVQSRDQLEAFVRYVFARRHEQSTANAAEAVQFSYAATVAATGAQQGAQTARVRSLGVDGMVLQTSWRAGVGETIRCEISAPASKQLFTLHGEVVNTLPNDGNDGNGNYDVQVRFRDAASHNAEEPLHAAGMSIRDAIEILLEEAVFAAKQTGFVIPNEHLRGQLARIYLSSLLSFFEMERLSGTLKMLGHDLNATIYLREGRVVDVDPATEGAEPMAALQDLMTWRRGTFEFSLGDPARDDRIRLSTSHLLLRLASQSDEQNKTA